MVYPGQGKNQVDTKGGNDDVVYRSVCELQGAAGTNLKGGSGTDRLFIPVEPSQLASYGITTSGFEQVINIGESLAYTADCEN